MKTLTILFIITLLTGLLVGKGGGSQKNEEGKAIDSLMSEHIKQPSKKLLNDLAILEFKANRCDKEYKKISEQVKHSNIIDSVTVKQSNVALNCDTLSKKRTWFNRVIRNIKKDTTSESKL